MARRRLEARDRREEILDAAIQYAEEFSFAQITREAVAAYAKCSPGLVSRYFATMTQLRRAVMRRAISKPSLKIVAQGLASKNPLALRAPADLREQAAASLAA